ncbi:MAG: YhcH/YjgK/YiaL family protein [Bacteroidaceae bacterium]|nr:YhcH/YjgK/YiaL family protein [Bacteroidaceae bacterium]
MIVCAIKDLERYVSLNKNFAKVVEFLKNNDIESLPLGRNDVDGDEVFISMQEFEGKTRDVAKLETHIKYIDIQMPFSTTESLGWRSVDNLTAPSQPYSETDDIAFFDDEATSYITLNPGECVVFFPEDAHAPGIAQGVLRKAVIKVKI